MTAYQCVSVLQAKELLEKTDLVIGDVRAEDDFDEDHIKGARLLDCIGMYELVSQVEKNTPVLLYCYHGRKSLRAANYLITRGFKQVYSLNGGFAAWISAAQQKVFA